MKKFVLTSVAALMASVAVAASAQTLTIGFADPLSSLDPQLKTMPAIAPPPYIFGVYSLRIATMD